jgi:tetratricopeptide (TPR) repeat protein
MSSLVVLAASNLFLTGCNRNKQDAIIKANEGDKAIKADVDAAISAYDEATHIDPSNHLIWNKLAQAYWKKPDWAKAAEAFGGAIKADADAHGGKPTFASYQAGLGYAKEMQSPAKKKASPASGGAASTLLDVKEAEAPYLKCIELDPNYADCYFELGNVYLWMDKEQQALEYYTKAIQHDPTKVQYYGPLADLYIALNYEKEAETVLKEEQAFEAAAMADTDGLKAAEAAKNVANNRMRLGNLLQQHGDVKGAITQLEVAKDKAPPEAGEAVLVLYALGNAYADQDPPEKQKAVDNLKGFYARACKGPKAALYKVECATISSRVSKLGGTLQ